jgi:DNA-directed RNA polymerase subunit beta
VGDIAWVWLNEEGYESDSIEDDDEVRRMYLEVWLGDRGYDVYRLISDPDLARRSVLREWLKDKGFEPDSIWPSKMTDHLLPFAWNAIRMRSTPACACGLKIMVLITKKLPDEALRGKAGDESMNGCKPVPILGKQTLRDGKTGESLTTARDSRCDDHAEAPPPGRRQGTRSLHRALQPGIAAAPGW